MSEVTTVAASEPKAAISPLHRGREGRHGHHDTWMSNVQSLAVTVVIAIFVITFLVQAFQIPSESMEDTLLIGDYLLVDKVKYGAAGWWRPFLPYDDVHRGDIIVFRYPVDPEKHFVKRVIGRPGDRLHLRDGILFINGTAISEQYAVHKPSGFDGFRDNFPTLRFTSQHLTKQWEAEFPQLTRNGDLLVPEGHYFVLGDNRNQSQDSRYWGFVKRENIVGKPMLIYLSLAARRSTRVANSSDDRIDGFAARFAELPSAIRWDRTFRFVH